MAKAREWLFSRYNKMNWIYKMVCVNLVIAVFNIILYSKKLIGLPVFSSNIVLQATSVTAILMSVISFLYANYKILYPKVVEAVVEEVLQKKMPIDTYIDRLRSLTNIPFASSEIEFAIRQYESFRRKQVSLGEVIELNNNKSMDILLSTSVETENFLAENYRRIAMRLVILDITDEREYQTKYCQRVKKILQKNEETLDKFDLLLEEISLMGDNVDLSNLGLLSTIDALRMLRGANLEDENIGGGIV